MMVSIIQANINSLKILLVKLLCVTEKMTEWVTLKVEKKLKTILTYFFLS